MFSFLNNIVSFVSYYFGVYNLYIVCMAECKSGTQFFISYQPHVKHVLLCDKILCSTKVEQRVKDWSSKANTDKFNKKSEENQKSRGDSKGFRVMSSRTTAFLCLDICKFSPLWILAVFLWVSSHCSIAYSVVLSCVILLFSAVQIWNACVCVFRCMYVECHV